MVAVGVGGFFGGIKYQQSKRPQFVGRFANGQNGTRDINGKSSQGFRPVNGEIISQDEKSVTVKMLDGSSKIVILSDTTVINKSSEGAKTDLKNGEKIAVFGTENSDGSLTAQNIQLNPLLRIMPSEPAKN